MRRWLNARHHDGLSAVSGLRLHWPEYLMEASGVAVYMFSVCAFATLLQHPASPLRHLVSNAFSRRLLMGLAVGGTVVAIVLSPAGKQSGGHFDPAVTLTFYRLGKIRLWDTLYYVAAQFCGAIFGAGIAKYMLRGAPADQAVRYAVTVPGIYGSVVAFIAEVGISFGLMITVLVATNREAVSRYTPYFVGILYALYITFESPLSGASMNPARTLGSALQAGYWHALWIYFFAPQLGMLAAAHVFLRARGGVGPFCAKLHHHNNKRCIFIHSGVQQGETRILPSGVEQQRGYGVGIILRVVMTSRMTIH